MKIGIMQPYFFPYLGYWQLINAVDKYIIYDDVNFIKNGWINRNNILLNGKKHLITIPLEGASPFLLINQIKMTSKIKDKEKILRTIEQSYKKSPHFEDVYPLIKKTILHDSGCISEALISSIKNVIEYLNIDTELLISSDIKKNNTLSAEEKVIHICKLLNGDHYINAIGGDLLYDRLSFEQNGIQLKFLKMKEINYSQFNNDFVANLSMIDVLMFNSPETVKEMLNEYELI